VHETETTRIPYTLISSLNEGEQMLVRESLKILVDSKVELHAVSTSIPAQSFRLFVSARHPRGVI
jgi:hypothetical protein